MKYPFSIHSNDPLSKLLITAGKFGLLSPILEQLIGKHNFWWWNAKDFLIKSAVSSIIVMIVIIVSIDVLLGHPTIVLMLIDAKIYCFACINFQ